MHHLVGVSAVVMVAGIVLGLLGGLIDQPRARPAEASLSIDVRQTETGPLSAGDNSNWSGLFPLGGVDSDVTATAAGLVNGQVNVFIGGNFRVAGNVIVNRIARYNVASETWQALGFGLDGEVRALVIANDRLYVGGSFRGRCLNAECTQTNTAEGLHRLASYGPLSSATPSWSPIRFGVNGPVYAIVVSGDEVLLGGFFSEPCHDAACVTQTILSSGLNGVARFSGGVSGGWRRLGYGLSGEVFTLELVGTTLYAGGTFYERCTNANCSSTEANGVNRIAQYANVLTDQDGIWSPLPTEFGLQSAGIATQSFVYALKFSGGDLYVGGYFNYTCADVSCLSGSDISDNIVRFDFTTNNWASLEAGLNGSVRTIVVFDGLVHVGGTFDRRCTTIDGCDVATGVNGLARWSGTGWQPLAAGVNGVLGTVMAMAALFDDLYVGGDFQRFCGSFDCDPVGATNAGRIASFNRVTDAWRPLGMTGASPDGRVRALLVSGGDVYVGGEFRTAAGVKLNHVGRWNRALNQWFPLGTGLSGPVFALAFYNGQLYAGGAFTRRCSNAECTTVDPLTPVNRIARFDGTAWRQLSSGLRNDVHALAAANGLLYLGGDFRAACPDTACSSPPPDGLNRIAAWNGATFSRLEWGLSGTVSALLANGDQIHAGGGFTKQCDAAACSNPIVNGVNAVATWNGTGWSGIGHGLSQSVYALLLVNGQIHAAGNISQRCMSADCQLKEQNGVNAIARFDGTAWQPLQFGFWGDQNTLAATDGALFVGGSAARVCGDVMCSVQALTINRAARWDPAASAWFGLGSGTDGSQQYVHAMAVQTGTLIVGGGFSIAGGKPAGNFSTFGEVAGPAASANAQPNPALPNSTTSFVATIANAGPGAAAGVVVTATLGVGLTFVSASPGCAGSGPIVCTLGAIPAGGQATVTIQAGAPASGSAEVGFVLSTSSIDPTTSNDSAVAVVTVVTPTATPTATIPPGASTSTPTLQPGAPSATPTATPTLMPGQNLPGYVGLGSLNAPLD